MKFFAKQKAKSELVRMFRAGGIYLTHKSGDKTHYITPKVQSVRTLDDPQRLEYVFTVPMGLDPKEVTKREWLFAQAFGREFELKQLNKRFTLTIYAEKMGEDNTYRYDVISKHLKGVLPIYCGMDVNNRHVVYDMRTNPGLLIAGETGSGKSTQVRSVLSTLILTLPPEKLHMYLADLKRSEFHLFRRVEHVKKVCTRTSELEAVLSKLWKEAERRGDLLDKYEVTHVDDLPQDKRVPYIVLGIDEVALLKKEKKMMELVEDLSAIGRALGMFLILSMQRPDAKVLDGKLKINLTVRMGFRCADLINSRIVGTPGSEKIEEAQGGRYFLKLGKLTEVQAPFLKVEPAKKLLEPFKSDDVVASEEFSHVEVTTPEKTPEDAPQSNENIFGVLGDDESDATR
jgi:S-DNA-T family DNA segregation ATPase FtsK/SpoIIIE